MKVPALIDMRQTKEKLTVPEIRVWCHPERMGKPGDDYYHVFPSFSMALAYIASHKEAEEIPVVAFMGYELNLWQMQPEGV